MSDLINFLTSKEIIMVYVVAAIACALYFVIHYIDKLYYQKRIQRQNTKELKRLVEDINNKLALEQEENGLVEEIEEEEIIYIEPVLEVVPETKVDLQEESFTIENEKVVLNEEIAAIEKTIANEEESVIEAIEEQMDVFVQEIKSTEKAQVEQLAEVEVFEELESHIVEQIEEQKVVEIIEEIDAVNNIEIEEKLDYTSAEPNRFEAQEELRRLTELLEQAEETTKNIDLTSYEEMQEKEAIISLEELMKRSKEMYESNELTQYADEGNEPISLEDLERKVKESLELEQITDVEETKINSEPVVIEQITMTEVMQETPEIIKLVEPSKFIMDDFYSIKEEPKKSTAYQEYKSMPVISPIYGLEKKTSLELENTANYDKLDEEIKKTNEFIMSLKELQENLD